MASSRLPLLLLLAVLAAAAAAAFLPSTASAADEYCRDSLHGLLTCRDFMFGGAPAASPACCDAYGAAFDADPFCLCYVANGEFGRSTGYDINVTRALAIPASCGQVAPPIELCNMQGLVLPPYEPQSPAAAQSPSAAPSPPAASSPTAQPPSGSVAPTLPAPSFTSPPPPPPTSDGDRDSSVQMMIMRITIAACVAAALA